MRPKVELAAFAGIAAILAGLALLANLPIAAAVFLPALAAVVAPAIRLRNLRAEMLKSEVQSKEFVQRLLNVIPEPVYVKSADGRYQMINEAFARQRQQSSEEIIGSSAADLVDSDTARAVAAEDAAVLGGLNVYKEDPNPNPRTGKARWRIVTKGSCLDISGVPVIVGANFDITRMREVEQALQQALTQQTALAEHTQEFIQHLIDVVPYPFYVMDEESRYLIVNEAFIKEHKVGREALLGKNSLELGADSSLAKRSIEEDQTVLRGTSLHKEEGGQHPVTGNLYFQKVIKGRCTDNFGKMVIVGINIDISDLRVSELQLRDTLDKQTRHHEASNAFVQRVLDLIPYPVYVKDAQSRYLLVNEARARDKFSTKEELLSHTGLSSDATPAVVTTHFEEDCRVLAGERILKEEHKRHDHTGMDVYRFISKGSCLDAKGEPVIVGAHIDLTDLRLVETELRTSFEREVKLRERTQEFIQRLIDVIPDPVYVKKAGGRYLLVNDAFSAYHGHDKSRIVSEEYPLQAFGQSDRRKLSMQEDEAVLAGETILKEERTIRKLTGEEVFRVVCKRRCVYVDGEPVIVGIDHHITEWRTAERELNRLAQEDALTGIANRRHFRTIAEAHIERAERHGEALSLLLVDIDHFKTVNDTYGHKTGDEVLVDAVKRSAAALRSSDIAGRWGGEEFVFLLPHTALDGALYVAQRLCTAFSETPAMTTIGPIPVRLSGGVAQLQAGEKLDALVSRADDALYRAKNEGRNRINPAR